MAPGWEQNVLFSFHAPGSVGKEEHTGAVEQPILKLAGVAGPILKLELANAVPPTWKVICR